MLKNYLKIAWKVLLRRKFFTFISLFGISFTLMILLVLTSMADHVFGAKPPLSNEDRLLYILQSTIVQYKNQSQSTNALSYDLLKEYVKTLNTPEKVSIYSNIQSVNAFINQKKLVLELKAADEAYWDITNFTFLEGNGFNANDMEHANMVAVINESTKKDYFGEATAIGKIFTVDGKNYRICGVVKNVAYTQVPAYADIWVPLSTTPAKLKSFNQYQGECNAMILAKSAGDVPKIKEELARVIAHINTLPKEYYDEIFVFAETALEGFSRFIFQSSDNYSDNNIELLFIISGIFLFFFLLLPSINLVNINISRIMERSSEIGVRRAFGAKKNHLVVQFLVENIFLTFIGCLFGILFAKGILIIINKSGLIAFSRFDININVLLIGCLLTLIFALLSGIYPAYKMSRLQPVIALKGGEIC